MDLEEELDALYRQPLKGFVAARNELAKRLRQGGDREAADRIKALPKPSLTAWAVNQLPSRAPDELEALTAAGEVARAAHLAAVPEQQAAARARRDAISALLEIAERIVTEAGQSFNRNHRQRISRTLEALSSRAPDDDKPAAGRLGQDLEPPGFDAVADLAAALQAAQAQRPKKTAKPPTNSAAAPAAAKVKKVEIERADRQAEQNARRREAARRALERKIEEARQAVEGLEGKVAGLGKEAEQAAFELDEAKRSRDELSEAALEAERRAREARKLADDAGKTASRARFAAEAATAALKRAEGKLDEERRKLDRLSREREKLA